MKKTKYQVGDAVRFSPYFLACIGMSRDRDSRQAKGRVIALQDLSPLAQKQLQLVTVEWDRPMTAEGSRENKVLSCNLARATKI